MTFRTLLLAIAFSTACFGLAEAQITTMTLDQAVEFAWNNNTQIRQKQIEIADADQQVLENQAFGIPQLSARADYTRYLVVPQQPIPETFRLGFEAVLPDTVTVPNSAAFFLKNNFTASIDLDAMVFDARFFIGLKAAKQFRTLVTQELESEKRNVRSDVVNAYLPILLINQSIRILDSNITIVDKLLFETDQLFQAGFAEQLDVDRQTLALSNLKTQKASLEGQRTTALNRLKYTIGFPVEDDLEILETMEGLLAFASENDLTGEFDLNRRPDFVLTQEAVRINDVRIAVERSEYFPRMRAFASAQEAYQGNTSEDDFWAPNVFVGASLSIPIFSGLERKAKVERARLAKANVEVQQQDLIRAIRLEVSATRNDYNTALQAYEEQQKNLRLAERIYNTTEIKYSEGVGSSVEVVQAQQGLYDAQRNYLQATYDLVLAKQNLDIALGN